MKRLLNTMADVQKSTKVAEEARKTFMEIRKLRKTMPTDMAHQRKALETEIKKRQDEWWERVKPLMADGDQHASSSSGL